VGRVVSSLDPLALRDTREVFLPAHLSSFVPASLMPNKARRFYVISPLSTQTEGWGDGLQGRGTLRLENGADRFWETRGEIRREHRRDGRREEEEIRYHLTRRFDICLRASFLSWMRGSPACLWLFGAHNESKVEFRRERALERPHALLRRVSCTPSFWVRGHNGPHKNAVHGTNASNAQREFTQCRYCGHRPPLRGIAY